LPTYSIEELTADGLFDLLSLQRIRHTHRIFGHWTLGITGFLILWLPNPRQSAESHEKSASHH